jgi:non-ribosomal peptide synthetase component F
MVLAAACKALLARYSGQSDICIGTPVANRNRLETEGLIGFFVNTLVLRSRVAFNGTFNALLQQVRATALGAYAHQDLPFEQLVEALQPERQPGHTPLFQTMLTQNATSTTLELLDSRYRA